MEAGFSPTKMVTSPGTVPCFFRMASTSPRNSSRIAVRISVPLMISAMCCPWVKVLALRRLFPLLREIVVLEPAHPQGVAVLPVAEEFVFQLAFYLEAELGVYVDGLFVLGIHDKIQLVQIEDRKRVVHNQRNGPRRIAEPLMGRGDDDLEFGPAMDVVDFDEFDQTNLGLIVFDDETALALIVELLTCYNILCLMNGLSQKKNPFLMNGYILDLVTCFDNRGFTKHYNAKIVIIG